MSRATRDRERTSNESNAKEGMVQEGSSGTDQHSMARETQVVGSANVVKVSNAVLDQMRVSDEDLRAVAEPYQLVVRAQLDGSGVRVRVTGNVRFGEESDMGRDGADGGPTTARSHAGFTIEVDESDQQEIAEVLGRIAATYRARAIGGAMKAAYTAYNPLPIAGAGAGAGAGDAGASGFAAAQPTSGDQNRPDEFARTDEPEPNPDENPA